MATFYHGSPVLFNAFDLSHVLEGDGKMKIGFGVYLSSMYRSAAHYSAAGRKVFEGYVYTAEIPDFRTDNHIDFKQPVHPAILERAARSLASAGFPSDIPEPITADGKLFRKHLAKLFSGKIDLAGEKAASEFLDGICVDYVCWPYNWKNPAFGTNCAVFNTDKIRIVRVDHVWLDERQQLISGSEMQVGLPGQSLSP